ncbi:hypothetical protein PR202_gb01757 [Eleusine coracana subsp. coracana]|uniref:TFIIF beta subunit HTH domain-containing protein n=1 Tax=Eleusine coracana subsp. coracana TaxID=191504 RepID=A0AAV5DXK8_ELECO|nr:hypothetical protein PR202_gb01757 [Eleusine coracana subsp. coracana]
MGEDGKHLETAKADRSVWLMKCPPVVSRAWNAASASSSDGGASPNPVVAKVVLSLDLLSSEEPSLQARPRIPAAPSLVPLLPCFESGRRNILIGDTQLAVVLDKDHGMSMRPMPGMVGLMPSGSKQFLKEILNDLCVYNKRGPNQGTHELKPEYKKSTGDTEGA